MSHSYDDIPLWGQHHTDPVSLQNALSTHCTCGSCCQNGRSPQKHQCIKRWPPPSYTAPCMTLDLQERVNTESEVPPPSSPSDPIETW